MTQEEKQLLLKDICARLPYGVICHYNCVIPIEGRELRKANCKDVLKGIVPAPNGHIGFMIGIDKVDALEGDIKPYLRPMSSMTEEEENEYRAINNYEGLFPNNEEALDYVLSHHLDFRYLITIGLALEAEEGMYN